MADNLRSRDVSTPVIQQANTTQTVEQVLGIYRTPAVLRKYGNLDCTSRLYVIASSIFGIGVGFDCTVNSYRYQ